MGARFLWLTTVLALVAVLAVGCGSESGPAESVTSAARAPATQAVSTTAGSPESDSIGDSFPWSGPYATVPDPADTSVTEPISGLGEYATAMRALKDEYTPRFAIDMDSTDFTDFLHAAVDDPMNATQAEIDAWKEFGDLVEGYASDLKDIEPPEELSAAHAGLATGWEMIAQYCDQSLQAIQDKDSSALLEAEQTRSDAEILMFASDETWPVGNAIGFWPHPWGD